MAQDPCAFNFIYTNYSDEKALFANFRHLQEHLNRIGCGSGVEDASVVLAASNSSAHDKERADVVCDGVDDQLTIVDAILVSHGTIGFLPGTYVFSTALTNTDLLASGVTVNEIFKRSVRFRGSGHVVWQYASNPASAGFSFVQLGDGAFGGIAGTVPHVFFDGIRFDAREFGNIDSCYYGVAVAERANVTFANCTFSNFQGDHLFWGDRDHHLMVTDCWFMSCEPTSSFFHLGGFSDGDVIISNNMFRGSTGTLWSGAGFSQGGMIYGNNADATITVPATDPYVKVFHNRWSLATYSAGDHDSATGIVKDTMADAKGDIVAAPGNDAWDNLTVGANQTVLVADSAQTLGLRYALPGGKDSVYGFYDVDLADAQSAAQLTRSVGVLGVPMAYPGSVVAIMVNSTEARTAGTATFEVFKNGTGIGLTAVLDGTNTTKKVTTQAFGTDTFVAGDVLDIRVTTSSWTPTTADVEAGFVVQYDS